METANALLQAYAQWRQWTVAESMAIRQDRWAAVTEAQQAKLALRSLISELTEQLKMNATHAGIAPALFREKIHPVLQELIGLESENDAALAARLESTRSRCEGLNASKRTLGRVHRSYAQVRNAAWHSYS